MKNQQLLKILKEELDKQNSIDKTSWDEVARENQKAPKTNWNIWLILAGRGFGKTRAASEALRKWVIEEKYKRIALIGDSIKEAQNVMVEGESGILSISPPSDGLLYLKSEKKLIWKNGAIATLYGSERYEQLRGPQFDFAWIDEFAKFKYPKETFDQLNFSLRLGTDPKIIITTTPRPIKFLIDLSNRKGVHVTRGTSLENSDNLSHNFMEQLEYLKGTQLEAQEIYGEIIESNSDELWSFEDISKCYKTPPYPFKKVVISVDPSVSDKEENDETGIIVCALDEIGNAFVLDDLSTTASPEKWVKILVEAYYSHQVNYIIIEANQGGDLIKTAIHNIDKSIAVKNVYASKSKRARAFPVSNLYKKQMVFHTRQFQKLETQMVTFMNCKKSPDRVDALVWGIDDLLIKSSNTKEVKLWDICL